MELTGWDSVIFTCTPPGDVVARIFAAILVRWPAALVEDLDARASSPEPVAGFPAERLPTGVFYLLFCRDHTMARHMEKAAYTAMTDGDGPFSLAVRFRRDVEFEVSGLRELHVTDNMDMLHGPVDAVSGESEPYASWICSPLLVEVSVVTPGNPLADPFSSWALGMVKRACRGSGSLRRKAGGLDRKGA